MTAEPPQVEEKEEKPAETPNAEAPRTPTLKDGWSMVEDRKKPKTWIVRGAGVKNHRAIRWGNHKSGKTSHLGSDSS